MTVEQVCAWPGLSRYHIIDFVVLRLSALYFVTGLRCIVALSLLHEGLQVEDPLFIRVQLRVNGAALPPVDWILNQQPLYYLIHGAAVFLVEHFQVVVYLMRLDFPFLD